MDGTALLAAIFGAAIGAAVVYWVVKRQWWGATGISALGAAGLLNIVANGNLSRFEHRAIFALTVILLAYYAISAAAAASAKARRRPGL